MIACPFCHEKTFNREQDFWQHANAMHVDALKLLRMARTPPQKEALEVRCEELQEEVRQLKDELYGRGWRAPAEFRLTAQEDRALAALVAQPGARGIDFLFDAATRGNASEGERSRLVTVIICRIRRKMKPYGLRIDTHYARGYSLDHESRARLLNWSNQEAA